MVEKNSKPIIKRKTRRGLSFTQWVSGTVLTNDNFIRRLPVLAYIGLLMLLYMAIGFEVQQKHNKISKLTEEIKELRTISVTTSSLRMSATRQSAVEKKIKELGIALEYNTEAPKIVEIP